MSLGVGICNIVVTGFATGSREADEAIGAGGREGRAEGVGVFSRGKSNELATTFFIVLTVGGLIAFDFLEVVRELALESSLDSGKLQSGADLALRHGETKGETSERGFAQAKRNLLSFVVSTLY